MNFFDGRVLVFTPRINWRRKAIGLKSVKLVYKGHNVAEYICRNRRDDSSISQLIRLGEENLQILMSRYWQAAHDYLAGFSSRSPLLEREWSLVASGEDELKELLLIERRNGRADAARISS